MEDFLGHFFRSDSKSFHNTINSQSIQMRDLFEVYKNPRKIKRKYYLPLPSNINLLSLEDRRLVLNGHVLPKSEWNNLEDSDFVSDFSKSSLSSLVDDIFFVYNVTLRNVPNIPPVNLDANPHLETK